MIEFDQSQMGTPVCVPERPEYAETENQTLTPPYLLQRVADALGRALALFVSGPRGSFRGAGEVRWNDGR